MDARNYEMYGYIGPYDQFIEQTSKNYQFPNLQLKIRYYDCVTFAGRNYATWIKSVYCCKSTCNRVMTKSLPWGVTS